jgi:hypothetical protein
MGNCVSDRTTIEEFHTIKKQEKNVISFLSQNKLKIIGQTLDNARSFLEDNGYSVYTYNYKDSNRDLLGQKRDIHKINLEIMNGKVINAIPNFI